MATTPKPMSTHENGARYDAVRAEVHAAFDHVALSFSCTLPMLLEETRSRGLQDDDVRQILALDEQEDVDGGESDILLQCFRSNAGVLYITRDTAPVNERVSSFAAFVELWRGGE